mmetsp:Transcript_67040/g.193698  ORF Transcript_67040/g.193698 Transcript_67040/m.193698 type:complete len:231 (+) Transcript_67040:437-1129(+)
MPEQGQAAVVDRAAVRVAHAMEALFASGSLEEVRVKRHLRQAHIRRIGMAGHEVHLRARRKVGEQPVGLRKRLPRRSRPLSRRAPAEAASADHEPRYLSARALRDEVHEVLERRLVRLSLRALDRRQAGGEHEERAWLVGRRRRQLRRRGQPREGDIPGFHAQRAVLRRHPEHCGDDARAEAVAHLRRQVHTEAHRAVLDEEDIAVGAKAAGLLRLFLKGDPRHHLIVPV